MWTFFFTTPFYFMIGKTRDPVFLVDQTTLNVLRSDYNLPVIRISPGEMLNYFLIPAPMFLIAVR